MFKVTQTVNNNKKASCLTPKPTAVPRIPGFPQQTFTGQLPLLGAVLGSGEAALSDPVTPVMVQRRSDANHRVAQVNQMKAQ